MGKKDQKTDKQQSHDVFSKRAVLNMQKYIRYYDLLSVILDGVTQYTLDEVDEKLSHFLNSRA